jgi:hypothetical protein
VKLLRLLPGTRTYECEVVGATCTVKLSSKSLADLDASGSGPRNRHHSNSIEDDDGSVGDEEGSGLDAGGSVEEHDEEAADTARDDIAGVTAADWRPLAAFDDQLTQRHPAFDFDNPGRLRSNVPTTPCDLFLAFFPLELVETEFPRWQQHARDNERGGLASLNKAMFMRFLALLVKMGLTGMRRREMRKKLPVS